MKQLLPCVLLFLTIILVFPSCQKKETFTLVDGQQSARILLSESEPECVQKAVHDLINDVEKITGVRLIVQATPSPQPALIIGTVGVSDDILQGYGIKNDHLKGKWESYSMHSKDNHLIISGSDERGTMFGIYHFIEKYLEVDPLYFWSDLPHPKKDKLSWQNIAEIQDSPTFKFRGWFINDEDLLTEWQESEGIRKIDYPFYGQVVNPAVMEKVVEALVRLRMNLIIPASFIDIRNPAEAKLVEIAAQRGVFLSMHHVEPMGVSAFSFFNYWTEKTGEKPLFSYYSNREKMEEVWRVYGAEWAKYPNVIWQIGLRGIADRPMWAADPGIPQSNAERGELISEAMATQKTIISEVDARANPPISTTLWMEGSALNKQGHLRIPESTMVVFADNCPGWKWQDDFYETERNVNHRYGVYYHHQLWGAGPHLAQGIPPHQTYKVFKEAVSHRATDYAILNVSNIRPFLLGFASSAEMLYNFEDYDPETFMHDWATKRFQEHTKEITSLYKAYFQSFVLHDTQQVPMLLDGQTRSFALGLINELKKYLNDPVEFQKSREEREKNKYQARDATLAINDAHPKPQDDDELLDKVISQKQQHIAVLEMTEKLIPSLDTKSADFLNTDLLAPLQIMIGLEEWLEALLLAKKALDQHNLQEIEVQLQNTMHAFQRIRHGQRFHTQTAKWGHWYRGEKKMNLDRCEALTKELIEIHLK